MSVDVRPVASRRERREFIELPYRLHSSSAHWVPPLRLERRLFLSPRFNPFFSHGEAELFLARRAGRVVGRVSAQVDHAFNAHHGNRWGMFGFLELADEPGVVEALLEAAEAWLRSRRCDRIVGPMDFRMNEECGVLIDGFERRPMIFQPWHPPYYQARCEEAGLEKAMDLNMWELDISDREQALPVLFELAEQVGPKHGITIRKMTRRSLRRDVERFGEVYNAAWRENWGFSPLGPKDLADYALHWQIAFEPGWFMVAEDRDGRTAAVAVTALDVNQALAEMDGRLLPFGWLKFLRAHRRIDKIRVGFLGVMPELQHTGVAALLYAEHFRMAEVHPRIRGGEMGWILENNEAMNRGMEAMHGRIVKRYRMYGRDLH